MKVLVISLTNIGDAVLTSPVIENIRRHLAGARITLLVGPLAAALFEGAPELERVIAYDKHMPFSGKWRLVRQLRAERFHHVVDLRGTLYPLLLGDVRGFLSGLLDGAPGSHRADRHLARLGRLGIKAAEAYFIPASESVRQKADALLSEKGISASESIVAFNPGARSEIKRWSRDRYADVARALGEDGHRILWVGDADDRTLVEPVMKKGSPEWISVCGETSLQELAAIFRRCRLLITNDSAPMHLARAVGTKTLSIFGPTDAAKYAPRGEGHRTIRLDLFCSPCEKAQCRYHHECMDQIDPEQVIRAAKELLAS